MLFLLYLEEFMQLLFLKSKYLFSGILLAKHDKMNFDALQSSVDVINATNAVALNVTKFAVRSGAIMEHCKFPSM